jgi:hypothetical protein
MANNHLEQLLAEWYEYQGYFVRRNVNVGPRAKGGYECELDVVAFDPTERRVVHLEPSLDADSWATREKRYARKFELGRKYIPVIFKGLDIGDPPRIEQIAVLVFASGANRQTLAGARIKFASEFIEEILGKLKSKRLAKAAVPEQFPLLRTLQYVAEYRVKAMKGLASNG